MAKTVDKKKHCSYIQMPLGKVLQNTWPQLYRAEHEIKQKMKDKLQCSNEKTNGNMAVSYL